MGIPSGGSAVLEWSIYPVVGDYWDFVNAVRRNWEVNFTITGPFSFNSWFCAKDLQDAEYIKWAKDRNLKIITDSIPPAFTFLQYMFPTTPVEIYNGLIFAKERIITSKAGLYAFENKARAQIVVINPQGLSAADKNMVVEKAVSGGYNYEVRIPSDHIAVLIRQ